MQEPGILDCRCPDDDVRDAEIEIALDGVQIADTAADLHGDIGTDGVDDRPDHRFVLGLAGDRAVEVDKVQATGATVEPVHGHRRGVFGEHRRVVEVTLAQANAAAVFEVNCGDQQHVV